MDKNEDNCGTTNGSLDEEGATDIERQYLAAKIEIMRLIYLEKEKKYKALLQDTGELKEALKAIKLKEMNKDSGETESPAACASPEQKTSSNSALVKVVAFMPKEPSESKKFRDLPPYILELISEKKRLRRIAERTGDVGREIELKATIRQLNRDIKHCIQEYENGQKHFLS